MSRDKNLELAAKAAGYEFKWVNDDAFIIDVRGLWTKWTPQEDTDQSMALAGRLNLTLRFEDRCVNAQRNRYGWQQPSDGDAVAAMRIAILQTAAEIGEGMG